MTISQYLKQPHPFINNNWTLIFSTSLFISLFIYLFEPFGCSNLNVFIKLGYGLVTFIVLTFYLILLPLIFKKTLNETGWTLGKEFLWFLSVLFAIGLGNFAFTAIFMEPIYINLSALLHYQFYTISIGIIPTTVAIMLERNIMLAHNLKVAMELNAQMTNIKRPLTEYENTNITLYSDTRKESIIVSLQSLLYIESRGNYIHIHSLKEGEVEVAILRTTLKLIESASNEFPLLIRCHRGFLVNTLNITQITGNTQGYKLLFKEVTNEIPLARGFAKEFQNYIKSTC